MFAQVILIYFLQGSGIRLPFIALNNTSVYNTLDYISPSEPREYCSF